MRKILMIAAIGTLAACSKQAAPPAANTADATVSAPAATPAALTSLNETSWEFTDNKTGKPMQESIDANGKYIAVSGKEHIDHGTAVMKDNKACFTSAMDKTGEVCWSDPMVAVGQSGETTSDKGEKLTVKRVAYTPLTM
jgi:hypothetical protein